MASYVYHLPVLLQESIELLVTDTRGLYIDGTLGGGGHTREICRKFVSGGKLLSFDKDPVAVDYCMQFLKEEIAEEKLEIINDSYEKACCIEEIRGNVKGILLDLGVSSRQLDDGSAGFSYRIDAPLDMRFGHSGETAADFLLRATEEEIKSTLRRYGEEPKAGILARRIIQTRRAAPLNSTFQLKSLIEDTITPNQRYKTLSRVFQALRIKINNELQTLESMLACVPNLLAPGGRIVIISYHSLEDRIVKQFFKQISSVIERDPLTNAPIISPQFRLITKKTILPSAEEISDNPRARSAKLRAAEKIN